MSFLEIEKMTRDDLLAEKERIKDILLGPTEVLGWEGLLSDFFEVQLRLDEEEE
jgi:hypothetical protein